MDDIMSSNDNIKPNIARLMFETYPVTSLPSPSTHLPYECVSTPDNVILDDFPLFNPSDCDDASILNTATMAPFFPSTQCLEAIHTLNDKYNALTWSPTVNTIQEESKYDIDYSNELLHYIPTRSRKRQQYRDRLEKHHHSKITASIQQFNGLYRANLIPAQEDNGANRTCTSNKSLLIDYKDIDPYPINGVNADGPALHCTGIGLLPWKNEDGQLLLIRCFYSNAINGTIISPNDVVAQFIHKFSGYEINNDFDSKTGMCTFLARDGCSHMSFNTYMENNLWYHYLSPVTTHNNSKLISSVKSIMHSLSDGANFELWHHRLGHPGTTVMQKVHQSVLGVPQLKANKFYSCASCNSAKFRKKHIGPTKRCARKLPSKDPFYEVGQHLHADFGFVRGSDWSKRVDHDNKLVTSLDHYRGYCLVIDRKSRYIWIFLSKTKHPPVDQMRGLLEQLKSKVKNEYCTLTTDNGGELAKSHRFQKMVESSGYVLKTTGSQSSAQNGLAEKPNLDLARMMRSMLYASGKGSEYWSYALRHAVYLKNRLPHSALNYVTPYETVNGTKPNLSQLRVFGSKVHYKKKSKGMKLDKIDGTGHFMTYKGTDKIFYVIDSTTKRECVVTHAVFDEAHMSVPKSKQPPMATALQQAGYSAIKEKRQLRLNVKRLNPTVKLPVRATDGAAAFDVYSGEDVEVPARQQVKISTKLCLEIPKGYYVQLLVRSSFASKYRARIEAGTIDSDYRGEVFILLSNNGSESLSIKTNERIAQLVMHKVPDVIVNPVNELSTTKRADDGFGSTGIHDVTTKEKLPISVEPTTAMAATLIFADMCNDIEEDYLKNEPQYNVILSSNPYVDIMPIKLSPTGNHPTKGLILKTDKNWTDKVYIDTCQQGTPAAKIKNWRKTLKNSVLLQINDVIIHTPAQVEAIFASLPPNTDVTLMIGLTERRAIHDTAGIPMMYFDQLVTISKHLEQIKHHRDNELLNGQPATKPSQALANEIQSKHPNLPTSVVNVLQKILPKSKLASKRLTRKKLKNGNQWDLWQLSEYKQLQQYEDQHTFGIPCPLPPNANCLSLLWVYTIKDDGTLKARCVCNGQPSNKNTVIFGYTYAKALDQVGAKIFWASCALKNMIVRGADASNAFAEADSPKIPLFVRIDAPFRDWWKSKGRGDIPLHYVLPVKRALQGHPEAPRAWATKIDSILQRKLGLKPTTHENCLYYGIHKGKEILFLRQVDDFAVGCSDDSICKDIIRLIDNEMTIQIKDLGIVDRFNGLDIHQTDKFIKISNATYIKKIINEHPSMFEDFKPHTTPIPNMDDKTYVRMLENATPPSTPVDRSKLQLEMNFNYRQAVGELIFAMTTCRPDISFPLIKLSQYAQNPAKEHYEGIVRIFQYLQATIDRGIYYWRINPNSHLPHGNIPTPQKQTHYMPHASNDPSSTLIAMDSDWAGDSSHGKSVTGMILKIAGGAILYKTKYQDTVALSTTEAEFAAACEAGKAILYVRSILNEIGVAQEQATVLHIDNNGALLMGNAQQPTRRTKHMDIKKFAILDWIERDLITMQRISTTDNSSDGMTKSLGRILHYRHFDYLMGYYVPRYADNNNTTSTGNDHTVSSMYGDSIFHLSLSVLGTRGGYHT